MTFQSNNNKVFRSCLFFYTLFQSDSHLVHSKISIMEEKSLLETRGINSGKLWVENISVRMFHAFQKNCSV